MGDRIATMVIGMIQLDKIKKARSEAHIPMTSYGLLFFLSPIPSQKRVARCTNILHTGATLTDVGEGQRLRKGFQSGGVATTVRQGCNQQGQIVAFAKLYYRYGYLSTFESLSSAAEIRHPARNTRLWDTDLCLT